jgi:hypothetical protein
MGTLEELDLENGFLVLRRGKASAPLEALGCGPEGPLATGVLTEAIGDTGRQVLAGERPLGKRLVDRVVPTDLAVRSGEEPRQAVVRIGLKLDGEVLAVQGPPGSGKTTVGADLIRALLEKGLKVGVTANSHAVIGNLLRAVGRPALQRCDTENHCGAVDVAMCPSNPDAAAALADGSAQLVGGTAWAWSSRELRDAVDVLVIDEAGQFSLANAVAVSAAARSLVLLGDPQQLAQPTRALHPAGAGTSVLEHLLDGHDTIPPDRGIFLAVSWRMHPLITTYVSELAYEGRLVSGPGRERQAVSGRSGIEVREVSHVGCASASVAEVKVVASLWHELVRGTFTDLHGVEREMMPADVLVVAPYNSQVGLLRAALPGARIGTVDKFQGQQAPVVLYSMTSSSAAEAPRGVGFLYDINRLNVAVSRAQALTMVVMNPRLLDAQVHSPEQLRQVNALCRLVEHARSAS